MYIIPDMIDYVNIVGCFLVDIPDIIIYLVKNLLKISCAKCLKC